MNALDLSPEEIAEWSPLTQAISKLHEAHFAVFNEMQALPVRSWKRKWQRLTKALKTLEHAAAHIREEKAMTWAEANPDVSDRAKAAADYLNAALKIMEQPLDQSEGCVILEGLLEAEVCLSRAIEKYDTP